MGRIVRLLAATAAATFLGISGAAAGWYGSGYGSGCCGSAPIPTNWGCGSSCAPVYMPRAYYGGQGCCAPAPVRWGCGSSCGYTQPVHVAYQGPTYEPPLTGYTYPAYQEPEPYVAPYRSYRRYARPAYRPFYRAYRPYARPRISYRYGPYRDYRGPRMRHAPIGLK